MPAINLLEANMEASWCQSLTLETLEEPNAWLTAVAARMLLTSTCTINTRGYSSISLHTERITEVLANTYNEEQLRGGPFGQSVRSYGQLRSDMRYDFVVGRPNSFPPDHNPFIMQDSNILMSQGVVGVRR